MISNLNYNIPFHFPSVKFEEKKWLFLQAYPLCCKIFHTDLKFTSFVFTDIQTT